MPDILRRRTVTAYREGELYFPGSPVLSVHGTFGEEFANHIGRSCPLPRELPFHKLVDWGATAGRFAYDLAYADRQPDWTYPS